MKTPVLVVAFATLLPLAVACAPSSPEPLERTAARLGTADGGACHPICAVGGALAAACDPCAAQVCAGDAYCCTAAWDETCVAQVTSVCGQSCTAPPPPSDAGEGGATSCAHPVCAAGGALVGACDGCAAQVCAGDPYCCAVAWDATCVSEVTSICGRSCP